VPKLRKLWPWLGVGAVYLVGAIVFLWPMPAHIRTHIWGDRFDAWTTLWLIDHFADGLRDGTLSAHTTDILFPMGYDLWSFGHAALQLLGALLMLLGLPLVLSYNLLLIGGIASSGLAAHALGRALSRDHLGGFVAGIAFCTSPYLYGEGAAGCIELVAAGLIPLFALTLVRVARAPSWRTALPAAGALAIVGPFNWYYTLFAGMLGLGFAAWQLLAGRRKAVAWMLGAMALAAATNAPLIPLVRQETPTRPAISAALFEDPQAWARADELTNSALPLSELSMERAEEVDALQVYRNSTALASLLVARFTVNPLQSTPGALAFCVGLLGLAAGRRRALGWGAIALGATILTLGPFLALDETPPLHGWAGDLPLPYYWAYQYLPFFSKAYRPYRIGVITLTCLGAMGAVGVAAMSTQVRRRWLAPGAVLLGLVGFTQPFWSGDRPAERPLFDARVPELYRHLEQAPPGAVVELPLQYQPTTIANARYQYAQATHEHPVLNCNQLIRRGDLLAFRDYVAGNAFLSAMVDLARQPPPYRFGGADLAALRADGFRYVVVRTRVEADMLGLAGEAAADLVSEPALGMLKEVLGPPWYQDEDGRIYELPQDPDPGRVWTFDGGDVVDVDFPLDALRDHLPLRIQAGTQVALWTGPARQLSFWARPEQGEGLVLRVGEEERPLELAPGQWTWVQVPVAEGQETVALAAGAQDVELALTRLQARVPPAALAGALPGALPGALAGAAP